MNGNALNNLGNEKNNFLSLKEENKDNIIENITKSTNQVENKEENEINESPKYDINYDTVLKYINEKDKENLNDQNEFLCNLLLMPNEIEIKKKLETFYNIAKLYKKTNQKPLLIRINHKIDKLFEKEKKLDLAYIIYSFIKTCEIFYEEYKNYFYAYKYANKCLNIINDPKLTVADSVSKQIQNDVNLVNKFIESHSEAKKIFFNDPNNINRIKDLSNLIDSIIAEQNNKETDETDENKKYLYVINKEWIYNLFSFIKPFIEYSLKEDKNKEKFIEKSFDFKYITASYLKENESQIEAPPFPSIINNYIITSLKDYWPDNENLDENDYIKKKSEYALVNYEDWNSLSTLFGFTNIIRRKKDNLDLVSFKFILFDKRINTKYSNINLLKERYIQVNKGINMLLLKQKIFRCADNSLKKNKKEKQICFFILDREKSNILIEMAYGYIQSVPMYESTHIRQVEFPDEKNMDYFFSIFDQKKHILIVEIIEKDDMNYFVQIEKGNYKCTNCFKELNDKKDIYKCNYCHFSIFCSKNCANNSDIHLSIDKKMKQILEKKFSVSELFSEKYDYLLTNGNRGRSHFLVDSSDETFFISTIHCLSNTLYLTKYFISENFKKELKPGIEKSLSSLYFRFIKELWDYGSKESHIKVPDFCNYIHLTFTNNIDPYELIYKMLGILNDELNRSSGGHNEEIEDQKEGESDEEASRRFFSNDLKYKNSIITDLFVGQYKANSKCVLCGNEFITFPNYSGISIPLPEKKTNIQIKLLTNNLKFYYVNFKIDEKTEMKDILFKSIGYLNLNKHEYIKYLLNNKTKEYIINHNVTEIPENILYNNLQFIEINKEFKMINIYNTSYENCPTDKNNNKNIFYSNTKNKTFDQYKYKDYKDLIDKKGSTELVIFEKDINSNKPNYINIYVYPFAEVEKLGMFYGTKKVPKILGYPVLISVNKKSSLEEVNTLIFNKFKKALMPQFQNQTDSINIFYPHFSQSWESFKMKDGKCPICGKLYNKTVFGCYLFETIDKSTTVENLIEKQGKDRPIILYAKTDVYDQQRYIYKGMELFFQKNNETEVKDSITLFDCLDAFNNFKNEEKELVCKKCQKSGGIRRKFTIFKLPIYLIIKLKRNIQHGKNDKFVEYKEQLDLKDYVLGPDKNKSIYDLYAIILHKKSLNGSSYYCYCKNFGTWLSYSMEGIGAVETPIHKDAYILFYKKRYVE